MNNPKWLEWGQNLQAVAQSGLAYTTNPYDVDRYKKIIKITVEMLATYSQSDMSVINGLFTAESGYATPKVSVRGAIFQEDKILLVKELADDGRWTLPGGWADVNDSPSAAIEREVWEESGYKVHAMKLLALYDRNRHGHPPFPFHLYNLFFLCNLIGGKPSTSMETGGCGFFSEDLLPELSLPRVTLEELHRMFFLYRNPDLPTEFD